MPEGANVNPTPAPNSPTPPALVDLIKRKWIIILVGTVVLILLLAGVILALRLQKNTVQNLSPVPPKVVCKRFTSLDEALKNIEIACVLDLSNQNLTTIPSDITKLTKLNDLSFKGNKLTVFPSLLLEISTIISLDLSNNQISQFPQSLGKLTNLQSLKLSGNSFSESEKNRILKLFPDGLF